MDSPPPVGLSGGSRSALSFLIIILRPVFNTALRLTPTCSIPHFFGDIIHQNHFDENNVSEIFFSDNSS
jgi:hypothetical protein